MKTIALIDPLWNGHHPTYFKLFSKTLLEMGHQVMAFCIKPTELSTWLTNYCPQPNKLFHTFQIQPASSQFLVRRFSSTLTAIKRWQYANAVIQNASSKLKKSPDLVFFPFLDAYLPPYLLAPYILDQIFPYTWSGIYFQPRHLRIKQRLSPIRRGLLTPHTVFKASHCQTVAVLDEGTAEKLQSKINKTVIPFPDITDKSLPDLSFSIVSQIQEKACGRKIVSLLGSLSKRKGLLLLLEVAQKLIKEEYFFVFAGYLDQSSFRPEELKKIKYLTSLNLPNCFFYFKRIPHESQLNALIEICDILFAVYKDFPCSSNFLTKAAVFKKPVIASNAFCMGERVKKFSLGLTIDQENILQCINAIHRISNDSDFNGNKIQLDFDKYTCLHSIKNLQLAFQSILDTI